jgi:hypothetical protein
MTDPRDIDAPLRELYAYWRRVKGDRAFPRRRDFDPAAVKPLLPNIMLLDIVGARRFRYRLVGTAMVAAFGRDLTGSYVGDAPMQEEFRTYLLDLYATVAARRAPVAASSEFRRPNVDWLWTHRVLLPMAKTDELDMILVGQVCTSRPGVARTGICLLQQEADISSSMEAVADWLDPAAA